MRKNTGTYSCFLIVTILLIFTASAVRLLHTNKIVITSAAANVEVSIKNGKEKVTSSQQDTVNLDNEEQATAFFQHSLSNTTFGGASCKQKNLIDAHDAASLQHDHNAASLETNLCWLQVTGDLQKILLLFPFHSFW